MISSKSFLQLSRSTSPSLFFILVLAGCTPWSCAAWLFGMLFPSSFLSFISLFSRCLFSPRSPPLGDRQTESGVSWGGFGLVVPPFQKSPPLFPPLFLLAGTQASKFTPRISGAYVASYRQLLLAAPPSALALSLTYPYQQR